MMETTGLTQIEWEISTSLDVRLGEYFSQGNLLEGYVLDVDPEAVRQSVGQFEGSTHDPHKLCVELVHPQTLNPEEKKLHHETYSVVGLFRPLDENGQPCGLDKRKADTLYCAAAINERDVAHAALISHAYEGLQESPLSPEAQDTLRHELTHATDYVNLEVFREEILHALKLAGKLGGVALVIGGVEVGAIAIMIEGNIPPLVSVSSASAVTIAAISYLARKKGKLQKYLHDQLNTHSPMEKRAYRSENESESIDLPAIATLHHSF